MEQLGFLEEAAFVIGADVLATIVIIAYTKTKFTLKRLLVCSSPVNNFLLSFFVLKKGVELGDVWLLLCGVAGFVTTLLLITGLTIIEGAQFSLKAFLLKAEHPQKAIALIIRLAKLLVLLLAFVPSAYLLIGKLAETTTFPFPLSFSVAATISIIGAIVGIRERW